MKNWIISETFEAPKPNLVGLTIQDQETQIQTTRIMLDFEQASGLLSPSGGLLISRDNWLVKPPESSTVYAELLAFLSQFSGGV